MARKFETLPQARLWTPQRRTALAGNLLRSYSGATEHQSRMGHGFYPMWNQDAQYLGQQAGQSTEHGAAMLARLSPSTEADANRMMGYQLLSVDDKAAAAIHRSAEMQKQAASLPKKSPEREAMLAQATRHRADAGLAGTPLNLQSSNAISEALKHRDGHYEHPLHTLGLVKINDFGHAIANPNAERQTIDTHYHDAMINRVDVPYLASRGLSNPGRYETLQGVAGSAYHAARERGMLDADKTPPNAFMGTVWYAHRERKTAENPDAAKSTKASASRIRNFMSSSGSDRWNPAAHGMAPIGT